MKTEDLPFDSFEAAAEKADLKTELSAVGVAHSVPVQVRAIKPQLGVLAKPWSSRVYDELCPEEEYQQQSQSTPVAPPNQCKICGKSFGSSRALNNHEMKYH